MNKGVSAPSVALGAVGASILAGGDGLLRLAQQPFAFLQINLLPAREGGVFIPLHLQNSLKYNCSHSSVWGGNARKTIHLINFFKSNLPLCIYYLEVLI